MVAGMASVTLVSGQRHHHAHGFPHRHHLARAASPSKQTMTLEDRLPQRSTSVDCDPGSDSARDMSTPPSPTGSEGREPHGLAETPTKKNKRKLSEPKKRADFVAKRSRQESPAGVHENKAQAVREAKKLTNGHSKRSAKSTSKHHSNGSKRDTSSPSSSSASTNESDCNKDSPFMSLTNVIPANFLSPVFGAVHPPAFGYVPGLYLASRTFSRPDFQPPFPSIPLSLQHNYITAAVAAAASSSPPTTVAASTASSSMYCLTAGKHPSSTLDSVAPATDHVTLPAQTNQAVQLPLSSSIATPSPFSLFNMHPSTHPRPCSSRTVNNDDDDASSSRAPSPEDLSVGGRMSRKHRKNYKNMTRERRVEANARERTRVHTISAAFDALRRAVPSYSHNQKLSKLAILRIASSYILALARLNDEDYTPATEHIRKPLTFAECVDLCTSTIQTEGRARRRH